MFGEDAMTIRQGVLEKKPSKGILRRYQKRWFELTGHYLKYFPVSAQSGNRDFSTIRGALDLKQLISVTFQGSSDTELLVVTKGKSDEGDADKDRRLELRAISPDVAADWKAALEEFMDPNGSK